MSANIASPEVVTAKSFHEALCDRCENSILCKKPDFVTLSAKALVQHYLLLQYQLDKRCASQSDQYQPRMHGYRMTKESLPGLVSTPEKRMIVSKATVLRFQTGASSPEIPAIDTVINGCTTKTVSGDDGSHAISVRGDIANEDQDLSTLDYSGGFQEVDFRRWNRIVWTAILAIGGLLDILASAAPILRTYGGCTQLLAAAGPRPCQNDANRGSSIAFLFEGIEFCHDVWAPLVLWLEKHDFSIAFVFSLLWFRLAFSKASELFNAAMIMDDRSRLLTKEYLETDGSHKTKNKKFTVSPQLMYYSRIFTEMMLLPVGFYIILYHFGKGIITQGRPLWATFDESSNVFDEIGVLSTIDPEEGVEYEIFTERSKTSVLSAVMHRFFRTILVATISARAEVTEYVQRSAMPLLVRRLLRSAIRNPRKLRRQLLSALVYLRWIKYLAPLIGMINKLNGNVRDMMVKRRQERIAKMQQRVGSILWGAKSKLVREEDAAIIVQRAYRAHVAIKNTQLLLLRTKDKKTLAALRIQACLRRKIAGARSRLLKRRKELRRLEKERRKIPCILSEKDRRRLYELQDEFTAEATETINRRLLMRPNTKFAVVWKLLFIICIGLEIAEQAASPWFVRQNAKRTKDRSEPTSIRELIAVICVPKPTSDLQKCKKPKESLLQMIMPGARRKEHADKGWHAVLSYNSSWVCNEPFSTWREGFRNAMALAMIPYPVSEWPECQVWKPESVVDRLTSKFRKHEAPVAWFCSEPYASFHRYYRRFIDFWIDEFKAIVSIVCFLDVFVTFFTGQFDPDTGILVPQPFFQRWVSPGLILQLLVNPSIGPLSSFVFDTFRRTIQLGLVRVFRWFIAVGIPLVYGIFRLVVFMVNETSEEREKLLVSYMMEQTEMNIFMLL